MKGKFKSLFDKATEKMIYYLSGDVAKGVEKNFGFVVYVFFLFCAIITWSLIAENDMVKVQTNEKKIEELRISYQQMELDYIGINNRTRIDRMLNGYGSTLQAPDTPPQVIIIK